MASATLSNSKHAPATAESVNSPRRIISKILKEPVELLLGCLGLGLGLVGSVLVLHVVFLL